jgi:hypothetical protein
MNNLFDRSDYVRMDGDSNVIFCSEHFEEFQEEILESNYWYFFREF